MNENVNLKAKCEYREQTRSPPHLNALAKRRYYKPIPYTHLLTPWGKEADSGPRNIFASAGVLLGTELIRPDGKLQLEVQKEFADDGLDRCGGNKALVNY
jgi:hypothetical protein